MSWEDKPTGAQLHRIAVFAAILGIREPIEEGVDNRAEARRLQYELLQELKLKNRQRKAVKEVKRCPVE